MSKRILVIDDDEGILGALQAMLEDAGFSVETDSSGKKLLLLKEGSYPDLILLDVLLSGMDGRQLCKEFKSHLESKNVPIIMLSAAPDIEKSVRESLADDFLPKPFDLNDLISKVKKYTQV